ncbi:unnamed protein product [Mucor fragilis]
METDRLSVEIVMAFDVNSTTSAYNLKSDMAQNEMKGFGADVGIGFVLNATTFTTGLFSGSVQSPKKGFCAYFGLNTVASAPGQPMKRRFGADIGFSNIASSPALLLNSKQDALVSNVAELLSDMCHQS